MSEDLAWAAGLFEGEGCFAMSRGRNGQCNLRARLAMTDEEPVRRFHDVVAFGNVSGPTQRRDRPKWNPYWAWYATGDSVVSVFALLEQHLGERRKARFHELWEERLAYERSRPEHMPRGLTLELARLVVAYLERANDYYLRQKGVDEGAVSSGG